MDMHLNKLLATCWARSDGMDMHLKKLVVTPHSASNRVPAILVSLSALALIGAATIIALPKISGFVPSHEMASALSDGVVSASLKDIQLSQQQNAAALESLTQRSTATLESLAQSSAAQQADLKSISDQLSSLATRMEQQQNAAALESLTRRSAATLESLAQSSVAQHADLKGISDQLFSLATRMDALQNAATPAPTFAIPLPTAAIPLPTARADVVAPRRRHHSRPSKTNVDVSIGDAPLSAWQSGTR
jgi:uncharacterized coiled-coil protein SlyX